MGVWCRYIHKDMDHIEAQGQKTQLILFLQVLQGCEPGAGPSGINQLSHIRPDNTGRWLLNGVAWQLVWCTQYMEEWNVEMHTRARGCVICHTVRGGCLNNVCCLKGCSVFPFDYKMAGSGSCCDKPGSVAETQQHAGPYRAMEVTLFTELSVKRDTFCILSRWILSCWSCVVTVAV